MSGSLACSDILTSNDDHMLYKLVHSIVLLGFDAKAFAGVLSRIPMSSGGSRSISDRKDLQVDQPVHHSIIAHVHPHPQDAEGFPLERFRISDRRSNVTDEAILRPALGH